MVTTSGYKIIKKAAIVRLKKGEFIDDIIASYPKLSQAQVQQLIDELTNEGYL